MFAIPSVMASIVGETNDGFHATLLKSVGKKMMFVCFTCTEGKVELEKELLK